MSFVSHFVTLSLLPFATIMIWRMAWFFRAIKDFISSSDYDPLLVACQLSLRCLLSTLENYLKIRLFLRAKSHGVLLRVVASSAFRAPFCSSSREMPGKDPGVGRVFGFCFLYFVSEVSRK